MSQINLDTSPYFDDFDADKDFYKVLFKPGFPVQARELTTLQSILQNQISKFGEHFFKEGSMVIPGAISYNPQYTAVILNDQQGGIDVSLYLDQLVGKTIRGEVTGVRAKVIDYLLPPQEGVESPTIFVAYSDSGNDEETSFFNTNEALINEQPITYGNTTITTGSIFATTVSTDATAVGSAAQIGEGVYFVRGIFAQVNQDSIVLEPYVNTPSYRVGLQISEQIVNAGQDETLYDNAKGFNNFSAPGADRLKLTLTLVKKPLNDFNDVNFVELLRVENGEVKKLEEDSNYNIIKDYLAQRTYDESGDYVVNGLGAVADESLNNRQGNGGIYNENQKTEQGSQPSDDLAILKVSPGKAYVRGFDINKPGTTNIDAPKPRTVETIESSGVPFEMGSKYFVNNVTGTPAIGLDIADNIVDLYDGRLSSGSPTGNKIGIARVYSFSLEDDAYRGPSTPWNLYLYDLQIFTTLTLSVDPGAAIDEGYRVKGLSSNATGYVDVSSSGTTINLIETSGEFIRGEQLSINGVTSTFSTSAVKIYKQNNVRSVFQNTSSLVPGIASDFSADTRFYTRIASGFTAADLFTITSGTVTCPGRTFGDFRVGDIVAYQVSGSIVNLARVSSIASDEFSMNIASVDSVSDVCDGSVPGGTLNSVNLRNTESRLLNTENSFLYAELEEKNIAKVDLTSSQLVFTKQIDGKGTDSTGRLSVNRTDTGVNDAIFTAFDQERYSVIYSNGTIATLRSEQFIIQAGGDEIEITGLLPSQSGVTVNVTATKPSIKSKTKVLIKSEQLVIDKISSGINTEFGMTQNNFYGLRVDDEEVSLNIADVESVTAVYESVDSGTPTFDTLNFVNGLELDINAVKGELLVGATSDAVAKLIRTPTLASVHIVYLSQSRFEVGERIDFLDSNIETNLQAITPGNYNDVTDRFTLDKGQREQFYDYSRLVRKKGVAAPNKKLLVVYDRFQVPEDDNGDFYTANSYNEEIFGSGVPLLKNGTLRASDTLDFRPRVTPFDAATEASPFEYRSRDFASSGPTVVLVNAPSESMVLGFDFYVGRKDRLVLNKSGEFKLIQGAPAETPRLPATAENAIELARIEYPPYVYNVDDIKIILIDNKRYTMRDIGKLEDRIETLEELTSLSLLERQTESLQVLDADGNDRFKSGFFADDFRNAQFIDFEFEDTNVNINRGQERLETGTEFETIPLRLQLQDGLDENAIALDSNLPLRDPNVVKTGDLVTLSYDEVEWIKQPLASRVENVNPFNVILYTGSTRLFPASDDFVITREIGNRRINVFGDSQQDFTRTFVEGIEVAQFLRERNVSFATENVRPHTRFYPFFEGAAGVDVIPKLIEINMNSGTFEVGETVTGVVGNTVVFSARVAVQDHKTGSFNAPDRFFTTNPYNREQTFAEEYTSSTTILNIDTQSLSDISDERFYGLISTGMRLVGSSSRAVCTVTDVRLVSDAFGELFGSIYFRDPYAEPAPSFRLRTGVRTFRLSSSPTNETPALGESIISFTETSFISGGTVQNRQTETVTIRDLPPPPPPVIIDRTVTNNFTEVIDQTVTNVIDRTVTVNNTIDRTVTNNITIDRTRTINNTIREVEERTIIQQVPVEFEDDDPLAQTFRVDETGAFLTSVDIYMASKSETDNLTVQIRPTTLGTPENFLIQDYAEVILSPSQVNISDDASIATNVVFPAPIYLEPDITYALVLLAPTTDAYTAWIARMGEANIDGVVDFDFDANAQPGDTLNNSAQPGSAIISQQYLNGSLFKSQNGSIWTPTQFEDLKFTLYKATYEEVGTVFLTNPPLFNTTRLSNNPITTLPRKISVFVNGTTETFTEGELVATTAAGIPNEARLTGNVEGVGGPVTTLDITESGTGLTDGSYTSVDAVKINSNGINASLSITVSGNVITSATVSSGGNGYSVGDTLTVKTEDVGGSGGDIVLTVDAIGSTDTLFLTNVSGEKVLSSDDLNRYDRDTDTLTALPITIRTPNGEGSEVSDPMYDGSVMVVNLPSHGMQNDTNVMSIVGALPDGAGTELIEGIDITSNQITVNDPSLFSTFEGITTSGGYMLVGGEIMEYQNNGNGIIGITSRGVDGTAINIHDQGTRAFKYEMSGVSLRRINTLHELPTDSELGSTRDYNTLPIKIVRAPRASDVSSPYTPQLSFNQEQQAGRRSVFTSQNFQFDAVIPSIGLITPGQNTLVETTARTITATSAGGNEAPFIDQGSQPIVLNEINRFSTPRMICSVVNEIENLQEIPDNKSFTLAITMKSSDPNLSPVIDMSQTNLITARNSLNKPVDDYASDPRTNQLIDDPHASVYISQIIDLENPATSLEVILSAYRDETADFRVCYRLFGGDAQGSTEPSWVLFPGYDNLLDTDGDGYGDTVIDPSRNSGLPNREVRGSLQGPDGFREVLEYKYDIDNLPEFSGFQIKIVFSGTNEARAPFLTDIRAIALA